MKYYLLEFIVLLSLVIGCNRWYCFCDKEHFTSNQDGTKPEVSSRVKISKIDPEHHSSVTKQTRISRVSHKPQFSLSTPLLINNELKRPSSLLLSGKSGIIFRTSKIFQEADVLQTVTNEETKYFTANMEPIISAASQAEVPSSSDGEEAVLKPSVQVEVKSSKNYQSISQQNEASISESLETKKEPKADSKLEEEEKAELEKSAVKSTEGLQKPQDHLASVSDDVSKGSDHMLDEKMSESSQISADSSASIQEKAVQTEGGTRAETARTTQSEVMPSFDEWKKMMLAEQEKDGHKVQTPSSVSGKKIAEQKRIHNYASYECGAKVVASNPEAEGPNHILNEMFDQYMLNPCKAKIWFVVELCNKIQASQIELANFELFSSSPKEFAISWSDRFPTREWTPLGVIVVEDQRALQSFNLQQQGFGKFIKLELLSHHGTEHYCPLSVVRVFGRSMEDEYDDLMDPADPQQLPDDDEDPVYRSDPPGTEQGSSHDIFRSAKDAVIDIVKKVAEVVSPNHKEDIKGTGSTESSEAQLAFQEECERYFNCTDSANLTVKDKITLPITSPFIPHLQYCDSCLLQIDNYQTHTGSVSACQFLFAALGPLVWERLCEQYKFLYEGSSSSADAATSYTSTTYSTSFPFYSVTKLPSGTIDKSEKPDALLSKPSVTTTKSYSPVVSEKSHSSASISSTSDSSYDFKSSIQPTKTLQYVTDKDESMLAGKYNETFNETLQDSITTEKTKDGESLVTITERSRVSASETIDSASEIGKSKKSRIDDSATESSETSLTKESRTLIPEVKESTTSVTQSVQQSSSVLTPPVQETDITKDDLEKEGEKDIENGEPSGILTKVEPIPTGTPSAPPGQKESVFIRMGNRIKALELNMSLSSQYLQELSQRYRRQMEEMQKAFNRTVGTLNDTARKAAVRDLHQREAIDHLEAQVANLTQAVDLLLHERQSAHRHMMETHLCLMFVEAIVMITILSLCVRRMGNISLHEKPLVSTDSSQPQSFQTYSEYKVRGESSSPSRGRKRSATDGQFTASHVNYHVVEPLTPVVAEPPPKVKKKHHRNKKRSQQAKFSHQFSDLCSKNCFSSLLDCDINSGQSSEKISVQTAKKTVNCENSHYIQKVTDRDRTKAVPLQNLTNGPVHINTSSAVQADKFNVKKFLKMQKKHSF